MYGSLTCSRASMMASPFPFPAWVFTVTPRPLAISTVLSVEWPSTTRMCRYPSCWNSFTTFPMVGASFSVGMRMQTSSGLTFIDILFKITRHKTLHAPRETGNPGPGNRRILLRAVLLHHGRGGDEEGPPDRRGRPRHPHGRRNGRHRCRSRDHRLPRPP